MSENNEIFIVVRGIANTVNTITELDDLITKEKTKCVSMN